MTAVAGARGTLRGNGPTVAVLARTWSTQSEAGWALRQVAGAIACFADVHVITPQGKHFLLHFKAYCKFIILRHDKEKGWMPSYFCCKGRQ